MLGCHENVTVSREFVINCEQKVNKEEKLTHLVYRNLLILLGKPLLRQIVIKES